MQQTQQAVVFSFTETGTKLNKKICQLFTEHGYHAVGYTVTRYASEEIAPLPEDRPQFMKERWGKSIFIFIGAAGIAVRQIAPFVKDKFTDSPVLVLDEKGEYVIPILSGHLGGAAKLASLFSEWLGDGTTAVQTTATDVQGRFAVDVYAKEQNLVFSDRKTAKRISAAVLEGQTIGFWMEEGIEAKAPVADEVKLCASEQELEKFQFGIAVRQRERKFVRTMRENCDEYFAENILQTHLTEKSGIAFEQNQTEILELVPKNIVAGIGCRRGTTLEELEQGLSEVLEENHLSPEQICLVASIDLKKDEQGLIRLAEKYRVPFVTYTKEELETIQNVSSRSEFVKKTTGVDNVCERAARYAAKDGTVIQAKCQKTKMTVAFVKK